MAQVVCFGILTPAVLLTVDQFPRHNTGALINEVSELVCDDGALVASLLSQWGISSGVIGNSLGDDERGRRLIQQLESEDIEHQIALDPKISTPLEVNISDKTGARTYFWQRTPHLYSTMETADLSMIREADLLYVDWYAGSSILRAMAEATRWNIPIFLNLEHAHENGDVLQYAKEATICQAVTDDAQVRSNAFEVGKTVLETGADICLVTMAEEGCLVMQGDKSIRVFAPTFPALDGCGAGATFSAGFIYGFLQGWDLTKIAKFASAAASLSCTVVGPKAFPLEDVERTSSQLTMKCPARSPKRQF